MKTKNKPDSIETLQSTDMVQLSYALCLQVINATNMENIKEITPEKLREMKLVLGYLNMADRAMKTKMQVFKMTGLDDKVAAVKAAGKV